MNISTTHTQAGNMIDSIDDVNPGDTVTLTDGNTFQTDQADDAGEHRRLHATYHGQDLWIDHTMFDHATPRAATDRGSLPWPPGLYDDRYLNLWVIDHDRARLLRQGGRYDQQQVRILTSPHARARWMRDYGPFTPNLMHEPAPVRPRRDNRADRDETMRIPDKPGLWKDTEQDIWLFTPTVDETGRNANVLYGECIRCNGEWKTPFDPAPEYCYTDLDAEGYAPFTPVEPDPAPKPEP